jgi:hypothetical protein
LTILQFGWAVTPALLITIFGISIYFWVKPSYGGVIFYPDWAHGIGWFLTIIAAIQVPLIAVITIIYYTYLGRPMDAFRPTHEWGPQDEVLKQEWIEFKKHLKEHKHKSLGSLFRKKLHRQQFAFDNVAMNSQTKNCWSGNSFDNEAYQKDTNNGLTTHL